MNIFMLHSLVPGVRYYRLMLPAKYLSQKHKHEVFLENTSLDGLNQSEWQAKALDPDYHEMLEKVMKGVDVLVTQLIHSHQGLAVLQEQWIDLALVDINMPVMNGEEMIEQVRANPAWADLPIVVISTEGSQTRIEHLEQRGAKFVHKPFAPEIIREVVREITGVSHV